MISGYLFGKPLLECFGTMGISRIRKAVERVRIPTYIVSLQVSSLRVEHHESTRFSLDTYK
jgi:hypothetical protein